MSETPAKPAKRRWYHNIADAYRITQASYPWMRWALIGIFVVVFGLFTLWGVLSGRWIFLPLTGLILATLGALTLLSLYTRKASYRQIEGQPGAAAAVMQQMRGWNTEQEPVAVNPRTGDMVFRSIGRGGVLLVAEGPAGRTKRLLEDERRKVARLFANVPIHTVNVGTGESQMRIDELEKYARKLPKKLTKNEITAVAARLHSLGGARLPIPKGVDPMRARPDRRGMRGR